jgi:hypothetical protein
MDPSAVGCSLELDLLWIFPQLFISSPILCGSSHHDGFHLLLRVQFCLHVKERLKFSTSPTSGSIRWTWSNKPRDYSPGCKVKPSHGATSPVMQTCCAAGKFGTKTFADQIPVLGCPKDCARAE